MGQLTVSVETAPIRRPKPGSSIRELFASRKTGHGVVEPASANSGFNAPEFSRNCSLFFRLPSLETMWSRLYRGKARWNAYWRAPRRAHLVHASSTKSAGFWLVERLSGLAPPGAWPRVSLASRASVRLRDCSVGRWPAPNVVNLQVSLGSGESSGSPVSAWRSVSAFPTGAGLPA